MAENAQFAEYVNRMAQIRTLSSPELLEVDNAEDYTERLRENFKTIGELAGVNRLMLDENLYPLLDSDDLLSDPQVTELSVLSDSLLNVGGIEEYESLDLPMMSLISSRLSSNAEAQHDLPGLIRQLDSEIVACYSLMNMTIRIVTQPQICETFREKGLAAGAFFLGLLEKDQFLQIEDPELRGLVLTNARFSTAFYERVSDNREANKQSLFVLSRMLEIAADPFYIEAVPGFDWKYFLFRTYEYYLQSVEMNNQRCFDEEQLALIADKADDMERLCASDPAYFSELIGYPSVPVICARARFLAGRLDEQAYWDTLLAYYDQRDKIDFDSDGCDANVLVPLELICLIEQRPLSCRDVALLNSLYRNLNAYIFRMPNVGSLSFVLEYYTAIVERFVEIASGVSFESFVLQLLAALHPPTYVHSRMVAQLTECLFHHLLELMPELAVGMLGCRDVAEVQARYHELVTLAYHAALCHDFGKASIIDTIFMYGRSLMDFEFDIIKAHPDMGARLLAKRYTTRAYADVARGHHRWYDDSRGYPEDFTTSESPLKTLIDLVACTDCLDAATDSIGRSYKEGKTLDDFMEELREGAGTRYAPWLVDLLEHPDVREDLEYLLTEGRRQTYRDTYVLLRGVAERG